MDSAKEPAEQQLLDKEAASQIELYENKRKCSRIFFHSKDIHLETVFRWFKDNWYLLTDETRQHFHDLGLRESESIGTIHCMHEIFFTYNEVDGCVLELI